jgi:hypothetical protein
LLTDTRRSLLAYGWLHSGLWAVLALLWVHLAYTCAGAGWGRLDLTSDGRFSLSDGAREVARQLEQPVAVRLYVTERLDPPYHHHRVALLDLLSELDAASGGQISVSVSDPGADEAVAQEALERGVSPVSYAFRSRDRSEQRRVWLGAAVMSGGRSVALPVLPSVEHFELEVVRAIRAVSLPEDERIVLGWWLGHGEPDPFTAPESSPLRTLRQRLSSRATLRPLDDPEQPIAEDVDVLVIAAPSSEVSPRALFQLDQFVRGGGKVLLFASSFRPDLERMVPVPVEHGLHAWLGNLHVRLGRDLLLDRVHAEVLPLPSRGGRIAQVRHPLAPVTTALDRAEPTVRALPRLVLPFASSLSVVEPLPDGLQIEVWAETEPEAGALKGLVTLDPSVIPAARLSSEVPGPHAVVVAVTGVAPSLFEGRMLPSGIDASQSIATPRPARLVVVSSADAIANDLDLVENAIDWLVEDPSLVGIRARRLADPELPRPARGVANAARAVLVGLPLLMLALGLLLSRRGGP